MHPPATHPPHPLAPPMAGYTGEDLVKILREIESSSLVQMDRWQLQVLPEDPAAAGDPVPYEIINNYFSIGVVRGARGGLGGTSHPQPPPPRTSPLLWPHPHPPGCLHRPSLPRHAGEVPGKVQQQVRGVGWGCPHGMSPCPPRPPRPTSCLSPPPRMKNKLWYLEFATSETIFATCKKLKECLSVEVRGPPSWGGRLGGPGLPCPPLTCPPCPPTVLRDPPGPERVPGGTGGAEHPQHARRLQPLGRDQAGAWRGEEGTERRAAPPGHH